MPVAQSAQAVAKVFDVGLLRLVHQHIARVRLRRVVAHLRDKPGLRHIEVAAALVDFLAGLVRRERRPFRNDSEVGRDLQQRVERQGPRLGDGLFHRQHADDVIADAQMIALGFDVGVDDLIVEKLRGLRLARNAPVVEVKQPAEERELALPVQDFDLHEVRELPSECLHALVEPRNIALDLAAQQRLHAVVRELRLQFADGPGRIAKEPAECRAHAGLRPRAFEQNAVEDLDLIKMVALRLKELAPLLDGRCHNRVVISGERNVGPVRLEEILVNMEAWAEGFQSGFQPLHRILLLRAVEAFVVHAGNAEHHADIAGLGKKGRLIPEAVQVDVVVESTRSPSTA